MAAADTIECPHHGQRCMYPKETAHSAEQILKMTCWALMQLVGQDRLTGRLVGLYEEGKGLRDTLRLALVAVGRGGQGDVGQRIRDEILSVQSNNAAKARLAMAVFSVCRALKHEPPSIWSFRTISAT